MVQASKSAPADDELKFQDRYKVRELKDYLVVVGELSSKVNNYPPKSVSNLWGMRTEKNMKKELPTA